MKPNAAWLGKDGRRNEQDVQEELTNAKEKRQTLINSKNESDFLAFTFNKRLSRADDNANLDTYVFGQST